MGFILFNIYSPLGVIFSYFILNEIITKFDFYAIIIIFIGSTIPLLHKYFTNTKYGKNLNYLINKANILRKHVIEMVARQGKGYVQQGLGQVIFSQYYFLMS